MHTLASEAVSTVRVTGLYTVGKRAACTDVAAVANVGATSTHTPHALDLNKRLLYIDMHIYNAHFEAQLLVPIGHPQYHHGNDVEPLAVAYTGIEPCVR